MTGTPEVLIMRGREWMDAVRRKDVAALESIVADEYIYTASDQGRSTRAQWLSTATVYDIDHIAYVSETVHEYGSTAVVFSEVELTARIDGQPRTGLFLLTDCWTWRDERWQVVARSSIRFAPAIQVP